MIFKLKTTICFLAIVTILGCQEILEVDDISSSQVELVAPSSGAMVADNMVNFTWNSIHGASSYLVQVATPSFENASQIVLDRIIVVDSTFKGTKASKVLVNREYEWRVKAINSNFETPFSLNTFSVNKTEN